ncbi:MAG: T9SS type A sorting domain-containing protein, partial [Bacteroidetes bacterium]|nr:T9SS type A sorting domain-containing protein [Bacteroidota bacterium]
TYYGNKTGAKVTTVTETTTVYNPVLSTTENIVNNLDIKIFPNPTSDLIAIQIGGINNQDLDIKMYDIQGKLIKETKLNKGQTISYLDIQTVYSGTYLIKISTNELSLTRKIIVEK